MPASPASASTILKSEPVSDALMRLFVLSAITAAATVLAGCAYSLGPVNSQVPGPKSIQINPIANLALEPRLTDAVTTSLRKNIQRDGTFRLDSKNSAD